MKPCVPFLVFTLLTFQLYAADYYWVGGGGNWSDLNHWRLGSSGGSIPSIVPGPGDNVFFDANSGFGTTAPTKTVTLNANGLCNNMTWGSVPNSPLFVTANAAITVQVNGSLVLSPTIIYNLIFAFKGATVATLTTNGNVLGEFGMEIDKPGSSLTVTDNLVVPATTNAYSTNLVTFTSGTFDITGKTVTLLSFSSASVNNARTLQMINANVTASSGFYFGGLNKTINAAGSTLSTGAFVTDGGTYNKVTATNANGPNTIIINNTTFKSLTFSPVAGGINSDIDNGNTVDTLIFNGIGAIGSNNTVGSVLFGLAGTIDGSGSSIRKIVAQNSFQVLGNYITTVDSLILAPNRITQFRGTFNINDYLYVGGAPCEAFTEINGDSTAGTVNFAAGAVVDISNVILTGVKATGPGTPFLVNGMDGGNNAGFTINEPSSSTGITLYWVGGSGDWNNRNHWSTASGGSGGACVPYINDNVVFDINSGLTGGGTVTTSSSSFCKNMTWGAGVGTLTFNESATSSFRVYGSVVLQPTVTMNTILEFYGSDAATLTTNGGGKNNFQFYVVKTGSGSLTFVDDWINPTGSINYYSGGLNMTGRTVTLYIFNSNNNQVRNLDISNATITANLRWIWLGGNKSITSTGSHITCHAQFQSNNPGSSYPWVDLTEIGSEKIFGISGSTFGQLTFTSTSTTSAARIANNNVIRRLEFKGAGALTGGTNNIDSLILTGSRNYYFTGTNTINKYFKAESITCSGLIEMRGNPTGTLAFTSGADLHMANIYMQNMTATGTPTPAFNGADAGGNSGWTITSAAGSARYWVGGAGDWNDPNHWSATSGDAGGACVPTIFDDVYFNAASGFTAVSKTVTVNNGNAYCRNIDWTGATNAPTWSKAASWTIEVWGDNIILNPTAFFNTSPITLKGANATSLQGTVQGNFDVTIDKQGGSLTLLNNYSNPLTAFVLTNGTFNAAGRTLNVQSIDNASSNNVFNIDISNSDITTGVWRYAGTVANHTLNAANSSITAGTFDVDGLQYNLVNVSGTDSSNALIRSTVLDRLIFTSIAPASVVGIKGNNNTFGSVEYKGNGGIYGTGNVMDTLIFFPGNTYTLNPGTNTTINEAWYGSGTPCRATEIKSPGPINAIITKSTGEVDFDYVRLQRITAAGTAAPFQAGSHTTNLGNNVSWNIEPYNGSAPITGLGPDYANYLDLFPDTLTTDGFFGSPLSQFTWSDGSTGNELKIDGPGTYGVSVSFVDGCSISDQIIVGSLGWTLPITITSFKAATEGCMARLAWKTADALHFSRFIVEQSKDGNEFNAIGQVTYATGIDAYSYTDQTPGNGTTWYRLKLVDIDEKFEYSTVASVRTNCGSGSIQVRPTITTSNVQVVLPPGYEKAQVYLINAMGQQIVPVIHGSGTVKTLSLQGLPAATYMLQVINGRDVNIFKIIKQ